MSEQADEAPSQNGEGDEVDQHEESQEENPNAIQSMQEAASNLLGGGGEEEEEGNPNPENNENAKKKRRVKKRVRVKKSKDNEKNTEEEEGNEKNGEEEEKKTNEEEEGNAEEGQKDDNEYTYEYQYDYEYYSDDEEKKSSKQDKKKNRRYPDRPDHLSLSDSITHLDVPYDANTSGPRTKSPRKKNNVKQEAPSSRNDNNSPRNDNNKNQSFSSTTPRNDNNSPRSPKTPREENKSPRAKKNSNLSQTTSPRKTRSDDQLPPLNNTATPHTPSEDVQKYVQKALNKEPILDLTDEVYSDILFDLAEKRKKYAINHNYKEGDRMSEAITFVEKCQKNTQMNAYAVDYKKNFEDEKSKFENEFKEYDNKTQELFKELKDQQQAKREALLAEQKREREDHAKKWTSDWMVRQYNKQSVQLTQMRKQHSLLLCQNRFKEAEAVNKLIVQKAKQEEDVNSKSYQFDYDSSLKMLKERQKLEIDNFESQCENQFIKLKGDRARRRVAYEFREKKINSKSAVANDPEKIWNASMLQRVENTSASSQKRAGLPSTRMKKEDLKDLDIMTLSLPALKVEKEKEEKSKDKGKGKEKTQENDDNIDDEENNEEL